MLGVNSTIIKTPRATDSPALSPTPQQHLPLPPSTARTAPQSPSHPDPPGETTHGRTAQTNRTSTRKFTQHHKPSHQAFPLWFFRRKVAPTHRSCSNLTTIRPANPQLKTQ